MLKRAFRGVRGTSLFIIFGMATTIGSVLAALALADLLSVPLNVAEPDSLVAFYETSPVGRQSKLSYPLYIRIREDWGSSGPVAATHVNEATFGLDSTLESIGVEFVSEEYFETLGLRAGQGRLFVSTEPARADSEVIAVISRRFATKYFKTRAALGSRILLNGYPAIIAGILAEDFTGLGFGTDVWLPFDTAGFMLSDGDGRRSNNMRWLVVFARVIDPNDRNRASARIQAISPRYREAGLLADTDSLQCGPEGFPWTGRLREVALLAAVLGGGGFFALLAMCLNVVFVMLAHNAARTSEVAVKLALGASRQRILAERFYETAVPATLGAGLSYFVAHWILATLPRAVSTIPPALVDGVSIDNRSLVIAVVVALLIALVSSLPIMFQAAHISLAATMAGSQTSLATSVHAFRFRKWLVGAQVSLCMMLIAAGLLLFRSVDNMQQARVAHDPARLLFTRIAPSAELQKQESGWPACLTMIDALESLAPVVSATLISHVPIGGGARAATVVPKARFGARDLQFPPVDILLVGPRFFKTIGLKLLSGRDFDLRDRKGNLPVVAVNEVLAERFWADGEALGKVLSVTGSDATIVAVVENARRQALSEQDAPQVYLPFLQHFESEVLLLSRTRVDAGAVAPMMRSKLESATGARVVETFSLQAHLDNFLREPRMVTAVLLVFGTVILAVSLGGVYSVASLYVTLRRREIGLRLALGATRRDTAAQVIRESFLLTTLSMCGGLLVTFGVARMLSHVLCGIGPIDPVTIGISLALTFTATSLAIIKPVVHSLRVQPNELLRST